MHLNVFECVNYSIMCFLFLLLETIEVIYLTINEIQILQIFINFLLIFRKVKFQL